MNRSIPAGGGLALRRDVPRRVVARLRRYGLRAHVLGLLLRRRLAGSGLVLVMGGWHLPEIDDRGGRIEVGSCAFYPGVRIECWKGASIRIGDGTFLNRNTEVVSLGSVTIGRDCKIGRDVIVMDSDQHELPGGRLVIAPVVIEDRVWIGARAMVLKGVRIGHDSVIGAGAIVTKNVPPFSVAVGQPARVIRTIERPQPTARGPRLEAV
jgi:acetyltransferase-like isoleucine patch superfamily enzyme